MTCRSLSRRQKVASIWMLFTSLKGFCQLRPFVSLPCPRRSAVSTTAFVFWVEGVYLPTVFENFPNVTDSQLTFESSDRVQHDVNEEFRARKDRVAELASFEMLEVSI